MTVSKPVKLLRPLPANRTFESLENQYQVEKGLADRLRESDKQERKKILATMYDELFEKVPDHSRLTRRKSESETREYNQSKLSLLKRFLSKSATVVEIGSGDCQFAYECAKLVWEIIAVEIVDQRPDGIVPPENFRLLIYSGEDIDLKDSTVDVVFSDQLLEHLHSEDVLTHLKTLFRIMKPNGVYVLRTPHAYTGPHDISKYFSDTPQGFHMKEYTFREIRDLATNLGFRKVRCVMGVRGRFSVFVPFIYVSMVEMVLSAFKPRTRRAFAERILPTLCVAIYK
jgi:SAM-dependent methyltransferase